MHPKIALEKATVRHCRAIRKLYRANEMKKESEIPGQTSLYTQTAEDRLAVIDQATRELAEASIEKAKAHEVYHKSKLLVDEKRARLMTVAGLGGLQLEIDAAVTGMKEKSLVIQVAETREQKDKRERDTLEAGAIYALSCANGFLSNKELARMLGRDAHGLFGLLSKCKRVKCVHDGKLNNEVTSWQLLPKDEKNEEKPN